MQIISYTLEKFYLANFQPLRQMNYGDFFAVCAPNFTIGMHAIVAQAPTIKGVRAIAVVGANLTPANSFFYLPEETPVMLVSSGPYPPNSKEAPRLNAANDP